MSQQDALQDALARFGLNTIRDVQKRAIDAAIEGQNLLCVMPTGAGKSLCYQLPALLEDGLTIVISPLLALMRDQVNKLEALGLAAFHISSAQDDDENLASLRALAQAPRGLFYISPEQLAKGAVQYWLKDLRIARVVIDEAHCYSEWGHDFRPDYRRIGAFLESKPEAKLSAFTATATQGVVKDLQAHLFANRAPEVIIHPPTRANITIEFARKNQPRVQLLQAIQNEPTIIYAATRAKTEVLATAIQEAGFDAQHYHAGLERDARKVIEAAFLDGQTPIIVATNAFGMGIDHAGIRQVIHADMPPSLEAFVQEIGRAGRDQNAARALCLFGEEDYEIRAEQIETSTQNDHHRLHQLALLDQFYALAQSNAGWDDISKYFLDAPSVTAPTTEDDPEALVSLKRWRYGRAQAAKIPPYWVLPDEVLTRIADARPQSLDALANIRGMGASRLNQYGGEILALFGTHVAPSKSRVSLALGGNGDLFERLKSCALALRFGEDGRDKPMDCPTPLLTRIAKSAPQSRAALARINGMNDERMARFGDAFLLELQNENR